MSGSKHISRLKKHGFSQLTSDDYGFDSQDVRTLIGFQALCFMRFKEPDFTLALDGNRDVWIVGKAVDLSKHGFKEVRRHESSGISAH
jgi:hypothetical protein